MEYIFTGYEHIKEAECIITADETEEFINQVTVISDEEHGGLRIYHSTTNGSTNAIGLCASLAVYRVCIGSLCDAEPL